MPAGWNRKEGKRNDFDNNPLGGGTGDPGLPGHRVWRGGQRRGLCAGYGCQLPGYFGGRSRSYEDELQQARQEALEELEQRAAALGADAVVGIDVDYEVLGSGNGMLMVTVSGTAVRLG